MSNEDLSKIDETFLKKLKEELEKALNKKVFYLRSGQSSDFIFYTMKFKYVPIPKRIFLLRASMRATGGKIIFANYFVFSNEDDMLGVMDRIAKKYEIGLGRLFGLNG